MKPLTRYLLLALATLLVGCGGGGSQESAAPTSTAIAAADSGYALPDSSDADYAITVLGLLGTQSWGVAVNESGQVTGNYYDAAGQVHVFFWEDGQMRQLVASAQAAALNESGQVVGWLESAAGPKAFLYDGGLVHLDPAATFSRAYDLNRAGNIAGHRRLAVDGDEAFIEEDGRMVFPASFTGFAARINDAGQVALQQLRDDGVGAWLLTDGLLTDLGSLGGKDVYVRDLGQDGTVVGWATTASGEYHAFWWRDGQLIDLAQQIGESFCTAVAVNNRAQVLIRATTLSGYRHYLWEEGRAIPLGNFGGRTASVMDLNDRGQIVGWLETEKGELRAFLATPKQTGAVARIGG